MFSFFGYKSDKREGRQMRQMWSFVLPDCYCMISSSSERSCNERQGAKYWQRIHMWLNCVTTETKQLPYEIAHVNKLDQICSLLHPFSHLQTLCHCWSLKRLSCRAALPFRYKGHNVSSVNSLSAIMCSLWLGYCCATVLSYHTILLCRLLCVYGLYEY